MSDIKQAPIVACCSARGVGGVALIRLSGEHALAVADRVALLPSLKKLSQFSSHTIHYGHVVHPQSGRQLDEVLFLLMLGPKTFTGFDTVEITCHGNPLIVQTIVDACIAAGARHAERGEFTRQAVENNRIDMLQAEAIHELVVAQSDQSIDAALAQVGGALSQVVVDVEERLVRLLAFVEASFEFVEEEQADVAYAALVEREYTELREHMERLMRDCVAQQHMRSGFRVACVGSVNAGKSTLFNQLIGKNRSIVSNVAGTTRDVVDATVVDQGTLLTFVDTAGIRVAGDEVEKIGIERSRDEAVIADVILIIVDVTREIHVFEWELYQELVQQYAHKIILVHNKVDGMVFDRTTEQLALLGALPCVRVSGATGVGLDLLRTEIHKKIALLSQSSTLPFVLNERHVKVISSTYGVIHDVQRELFPVAHYEIAAMQLRDALEVFSQMTGRNVTEKVLDKVFSTFCLGK